MTTTWNAPYITCRHPLHWSFVRLFVEGDFAYLDGNQLARPPRPSPSMTLISIRRFIDISPFNYAKDGFGFTLRLGRQELLFDKQKLVGPLDWANTRRTWDGGSAMFQWEQFKAELFWVRPVVVSPKLLDAADGETNFAGAYLTHPLFDKDNNFSLFTYYLNRSRNTKSTFSAGETEFNPDLQAGDTDTA